MPAAVEATPARVSQTKIVATVGPACSQREMLSALITAGVDVFRLNMAHGGPKVQQQNLDAIRAAADALNRPVAVLVDLAGPKMRLGEVPDGELILDADARVRFIRANAAAQSQPSAAASAPDIADDDAQPAGKIPELATTYEPLVDELAVGDRVMLADGTVALEVTGKTDRYAECRVIQPGTVRSRQGVNLPGVSLSVPTLGPTDLENAAWAAGAGIDFVGLSFVRRPEDVRQLKSLLQDHNSQAQVVAKIEKPEAVEQLEEIVLASDAIMVARGDLGVEIDIAEVPVVQKRIIATCHRHRKPVIIATQMLDSMQRSRLPTRAEVTDVANAILDGADACMLSGETAIGEYPRLAVEMMHRIALATEPLCRQRSAERSDAFDAHDLNPITEATVRAAGQIAEQIDAKTVVVASRSGTTALSLAKHRYYMPTVGVSDSEATLRRMCLYWGVIPLPDAPTHDSKALLANVIERGRAAGMLTSGDRVVLIAGTGLKVSAHNTVVIHELD